MKMLLNLIISVPLWAWRAYVAAKLWAWFAEPLGAAHVSTARMMGLGVVALLATRGFSQMEYTFAKKTSDEEDWEWLFVSTVLGLVAPALALGFGWFYSLFL